MNQHPTLLHLLSGELTEVDRPARWPSVDVIAGLPVRMDYWYQPEPESEWNYVVDDFGLAYTAPGYPRVFCNVGRRIGAYTWIGLAPDSDYRSWRNQRLLFGETDRDLSAVLHVTVEEAPSKTVARVAQVRVTICRGDWKHFQILRPSRKPIPDNLLTQIRSKVERLQRWYTRERDRRDRGLSLETAADHYADRLANQ